MKNCGWCFPKIAEYAGVCVHFLIFMEKCVDDFPRTCVKDGVSYQISNQIHVNHSKSNNFNNRVLPLCLHCWRILRTTSEDTGLIFHWMSVDGTLWFSKLKIKDLPIQTLKFWEPFQRDILLMSFYEISNVCTTAGLLRAHIWSPVWSVHSPVSIGVGLGPIRGKKNETVSKVVSSAKITTSRPIDLWPIWKCDPNPNHLVYV